MERKIDPMTFAILAKRLDMIGAAMRDTGLMSACSAVISNQRDFSVSIFDSQCRLVEMEAALPAHIVGTDILVKEIAKDFEGDTHPGDMLLSNDPFRGGAHISDLTFCAPVFIDDEHMFWAVTRAHQADVGHCVPSDCSPMLTDIYHEGNHVPPLRIERDWKPIKDVQSFYFANIRYRDQTEGDFQAMAGCTRVGERGLIELCKEYGKELIKQFIEEYIDYADEMTAAELRAIPDGKAYAELEADPDPSGYRIITRCKLTKKDDMIIADLTESSDQVPSVNTTRSCAHASVAMPVAYCIDPNIPKNYGFLKHIQTITRPGSIMDPLPPAGTSVATTYVATPLADVVMKCMMQLIPEKATAGWGHCGLNMMASGIDRRKGRKPRPFMGFYVPCGGAGAVKGYDGWPALLDQVAGGGLLVQSVETNEYQVPILTLEQRVWTDAVGDGQWRGGWGLQNAVQYLAEDITLAPAYGGGHMPGQSPGGAGGTSGVANYEAIRNLKTGEETPCSNWSTTPLTQDEVVIHRKSGGGGWGDPLNRDPELVRKDARNSIISLAKARDVYGVVIDTTTETFTVDYEATKKLRKELRKKKGD